MVSQLFGHPHARTSCLPSSVCPEPAPSSIQQPGCKMKHYHLRHTFDPSNISIDQEHIPLLIVKKYMSTASYFHRQWKTDIAMPSADMRVLPRSSWSAPSWSWPCSLPARIIDAPLWIQEGFLAVEGLGRGNEEAGDGAGVEHHGDEARAGKCWVAVDSVRSCPDTRARRWCGYTATWMYRI